MSEVPVVDVGGLVSGDPSRHAIAAEIRAACRDLGFFYVVNHGVDVSLQDSLERLSREFFALPAEEKMQISMAHGGPAWRGYFPVGEELTSGSADLKEGIYFGAELDDDHPQVRARTPLHGRNLFPRHPAALRDVVLRYMSAMVCLGHSLMQAIALSLGLDERYFARRYLRDPFTLFRIFHYPPAVAAAERQWGVGEHTDYGVLTILKQDDTAGLQVKAQSRWIDAEPIPGSFVINIGDMLERMTSGLYRSTPHRVRNSSNRGRLSFPFFFDPSFDAVIEPIDVHTPPVDDRNERWDGVSVHSFDGTYGDYLLGKVSKVFPGLRRAMFS